MERLLAGLKSAGEPTRLRLLALLAASELNVTHLTDILGQSQPRVSRHLKLLCDGGLLSRNREGSWVLYRLAETGPGAELARAIIRQLPKDDPVIVRDRRLLQELLDKRAEQAAQYFKDNAQEWDSIRSLHVSEEQVEAAMREAIGHERISVMLDLGTGTGRMLELFSNQFDLGIGIDNSPAMLTYARDKLERGGNGHVQMRHGDIYSLPYEGDMADLVVIHMVLHYLETPADVLKEAARMLTPGGRLLVVDFTTHDLEFLRDDYAHLRLGIDDDQMTRWMSAARLKMTRHSTLPPAGGSSESGLTVGIWTGVKSPSFQRQQGPTVSSLFENAQ